MHGGLHQLLDVLLLLVGELMWVAARAARSSAVRGCQLVVVLPGAVCHQVGVVGWGGVIRKASLLVWRGEKRLGRKGPPQFGDQWGSLTTKSVG